MASITCTSTSTTTRLLIASILALNLSLAVAEESSMSWDFAKNLVQSGLANSGNLLAQDDPARLSAFRQSINQATSLIQEYRKNGLSMIPNMPNIPVVSTLANLPDKLIRAELSMLQDEIKMAQEMMDNPLSGTVNIPTNLANMFNRIGDQLST